MHGQHSTGSLALKQKEGLPSCACVAHHLHARAAADADSAMWVSCGCGVAVAHVTQRSRTQCLPGVCTTAAAASCWPAAPSAWIPPCANGQKVSNNESTSDGSCRHLAVESFPAAELLPAPRQGMRGGSRVAEGRPLCLCSVGQEAISLKRAPAHQIWYSAVTAMDARPTARPTTLRMATLSAQDGRIRGFWG